MKREIKFRLIKANKIVGYERFAHGAWRYSRDGIQWNDIFIDHDDKDQYFALKVNDQEVYERDILKYQNGRLSDPIEFPKDYTWLKARTEVRHWRTDVEVIGNIYEKPELVK
jgi:hypothetical protein